MELNDSSIPVSHGETCPGRTSSICCSAKGESQRTAIARRASFAVAAVVERQIECGVTTVNDGDYVKARAGGNYGSYIYDRLEGSQHGPARSGPSGAKGSARRDVIGSSSPRSTTPACGSPEQGSRSGQGS